MNHPSRPIRMRSAAAVLTNVCFAWLGLWCAPQAWATIQTAEIVMVTGQGERREPGAADWLAAKVKQQLVGGSFVRTLANSQVAILMADRTQIRLNQNSQLQIKSSAEASQWTTNAVQLDVGRAWSKAQPLTKDDFEPAKSRKLIMGTPTATMSIRGTDWEVEVAPDGQTQLVVLSGLVVMDNEYGSVEVASGEAAVAAVGKAPVKLVLVNPKSRVQWVSSWRPQPARWLGTDAARYAQAVRLIDSGDYGAALQELRPAAARDPLAALLVADLLVMQGESEAALATLSAHGSTGNRDPRVAALLARALMRLDRLNEAGEVLDSALVVSANNVELLLARGELAVLHGDAALAKRVYAEATALEPNNAEAWYGLGLIESERENIREARELLNQALLRNAQLSKASAELAAAESFAGNLARSETLLGEILTRDPANYVALTAKGINHLKAGRTQDALEDFLRAGLIEPRYARAWLFSGVAYYQLGEQARALQAFARAAEIDERDPMAHLFGSIMLADSLDFGRSIAAAREAQERMPFLKSLNQIANDQRGSANLGSALANFGMEEWAKHHADQASTPFWAGSHLFLADRYTGKFNKNSELMQGYLTDPTVFGAANRNSALVAAPGHHGRIDVIAERNDWLQGALIGTVNGLRIDPFAMAYFLSGDISTTNARKDDSTGRGGNLTLGLGAKPRYDIGIFGFATNTSVKATLRQPSLPDDSLTQSETRADLGINYKLAPDNQFWFKAGDGRQQNDVAGPFVSQSTADSLNRRFNTTIFTPNGQLDRFSSGLAQDDYQFRHSLASGVTQWSWGIERSRQDRNDQLVTTFFPVRIGIAQAVSIQATDAYVSARHDMGSTVAQIDLFSQRVDVRRATSVALDLVPAPINLLSDATDESQATSELNPRLGFKWQPSAHQVVRLVGQRWRRPASAGQLAPVDTLGVPVNDRLPVAGGLYKRVRLQYDGLAGKSWFVHGFIDQESIDNGLAGQRTAITGFEVTQLESLRNRSDVFSPQSDIEETPSFAEGRVATLGLAANVLLSDRVSLAARYLRRDSRQQGVNAGLQIPYMPRDFLSLGSQWSLPDRLLLGARATYRSARFHDDKNTEPISAGWAFGLTAYWETADKRSSVQVLLDNLLSNPKAGLEPDAHLVVRYTLRF